MQTIDRILSAIKIYTGTEYLKLNGGQISEHRMVLASLLATFSDEVSNIRRDADIQELMAEKSKIEIYKKHRLEESSQKDAELEAKYSSLDEYVKAINLRADARRYQMLYDSCKDILNAMSSRLRELETERRESNIN